ncbi:major facilitator superfamily domain-containing protein [Xylariaceae sp. FL0255]|nr:major facilitator superfamily domain-containing protein [Xylariaceae sp. FL0255]
MAHHNPPIGEIPVPHGPVGEDTSYATDYEKQIFSHILQPSDSFTPEGVYWADLPLGQRMSFVNKVEAEESKKERASLWAMFKADPLSPIGWYLRNAVLPGAGLLLEGYVLFSIGNLSTLFADVWPHCWGSKATKCSKNWVAAVTYLEIIGIMVGQTGVGIIGDWLGRRWGLIQDAAIMLFGLVLLTAAWGVTLQNWVIFYAWSLFIYGLGVGGEYPITATSSMENAVAAGKISTREDRLHRGRKVTTAFLMQGWGQLFNLIILIVLLLIFNRGYGSPPYSEEATQYAFRISFGIPALGTLWLVYYRTYKMKRASSQLEKAKKKASVTGYDVKSFKTTWKYFGGRLFATAGTWFANDVFFYGNKLFSGTFIKLVTDDPNSLLTQWSWALLNSAISLAGYYAASFLIDNKIYGRKNMMQVGFLVCFITFIIPAFKFDYFSSKAGAHGFQALYFLSSFFNQFGPNCVTFLVAAEVYPTQVRATAHGFSAMIGKSGALLAAVLYNYISNQTKFYVVPWFGLAGVIITAIWLPDTTGLDLKEQERRWQYILEGRADEYHGIAIHPQHLSLWERWMGVGKNYHPDLDMKQKIHDLRADWEEKQAARGVAEADAGVIEDDDEDLTVDVHNYFKGLTPTRSLEQDFNKQAPKAGSSSADGSMNEKQVFSAGDEL